MTDDLHYRTANGASPHGARPRRSTSNLTLAPLRDDNAAASPAHCQGTPKCHLRDTQRRRRVVALTELEDPCSPWAKNECIKITQRDLRRCGDDLGLLRKCESTIIEPFPSPVHDAAVGRRKVDMDCVALQLRTLGEAEQTKDKTCSVRVKGRWSNMADIDRLPVLSDRRGVGEQRGLKVRTLSRSESSTSVSSGAPSCCTSRVASRPTSRPVSRAGSNQITGSRKRCLSTSALSESYLPDL
jgi:hypothetical protein